ncbi:protein hairy [Ooceraea biroi]|uniref:Protein deadpan n=1 Tax=Ooceraea biroi TaxID=2015173 RepID=A0A026VZJ9_OOCBI|nr:protein hairy [Ooceraea biroi]EZA49218.1 Protein deadpan [Ooceraea biroi]
MVPGVGATMPTGGVTVGATPPAQHVPQEAGQPAQTTPTSTTTTRRSGENRRSNKPIMEKRRRARINNSLNDLKTLVLESMKKDPARHSKLEKADILELTVKHLESLQRQQVALATAADPTILNKFRAGYSECATEVSRFPGLETTVRRRLMTHLASCLGPMEVGSASNQPTTTQQTAQPAPPTTQLQVHILPQVDSTPRIQVQQPNGILLTNANYNGLQLVSTRLPNGDIALVLPAGAKAAPVASSPSSSPEPDSPLPNLIPFPQRTASTGSTSSASSSSSSSSTSMSPGSPVAFEAPPAAFREQATAYSPANSHRDVATSPASPAYTSDPEFDSRVFGLPLPKPLALVTRKDSMMESGMDKPWRPW